MINKWVVDEQTGWITQEMNINQSFNSLIESCPTYRDLNRYHGQITVALHRSDDRALYGSEFIAYFESEPFGSSDLYQWDTKRVDEIINLHIWKVSLNK